MATLSSLTDESRQAARPALDIFSPSPVPIAADLYGKNPIALQLRAMNIIYETTQERGATILIPAVLADAMTPGGILGLAQAATRTDLKDAP